MFAQFSMFKNAPKRRNNYFNQALFVEVKKKINNNNKNVNIKKYTQSLAIPHPSKTKIVYYNLPVDSSRLLIIQLETMSSQDVPVSLDRYRTSGTSAPCQHLNN